MKIAKYRGYETLSGKGEGGWRPGAHSSSDELGVLSVREILIWERVHNILWQTLDPILYDKVIDRLFDQLLNHLDRWKSKRHPEDTDTIFIYRVHVATDEDWLTFDFHVCDTISPNHLFVMDVIRRPGKV